MGGCLCLCISVSVSLTTSILQKFADYSSGFSTLKWFRPVFLSGEAGILCICLSLQLQIHPFVPVCSSDTNLRGVVDLGSV